MEGTLPESGICRRAASLLLRQEIDERPQRKNASAWR